MNELKEKIRTIPDFPKKGIMFKDITTLLQESHLLKKSIEGMKGFVKENNLEVNKVVCAESRGFIFGSILAYELNAGIVPLRKPGKLPYKKIRQEYELEYGMDSFEMHEDAIAKGEKILIVDDLLATGGTARAAIDLVEKLGGEIQGLMFLIELSFLNGRKKLKNYKTFSLIKYSEE
ncbi:MAG TPA: adenine phosphoribosyltransferase [archaeon]|nr:adenine phosphoribosyltransferase [archaeon]